MTKKRTEKIREFKRLNTAEKIKHQTTNEREKKKKIVPPRKNQLHRLLTRWPSECAKPYQYMRVGIKKYPLNPISVSGTFVIERTDSRGTEGERKIHTHQNEEKTHVSAQKSKKTFVINKILLTTRSSEFINNRGFIATRA